MIAFWTAKALDTCACLNLSSVASNYVFCGLKAFVSPKPFEPGEDGYQEYDSTEILKRVGAYLPHWEKDGGSYSVTFRLFDSLPQCVLNNLVAEREQFFAAAKKRQCPLSEFEEARLQYLFSEKIDAYIDAGYGFCWMKDPVIARLVADAIRFFDGTRYLLYAWCVMPNHVHVVMKPVFHYTLPNILHSWKSFTARQANQWLKRSGSFWQPEYYDHLIRSEEDFRHSINYVLGNPQKAGLKHWPWIGVGSTFGSST